MASIGALSVELTADSTQLNAALGRAQDAVGRTSAKMREGVNVAGKYAAAAAAAGAAVLTALVARQMKAIDATAKMADRLGIATERLTGLQRAADLTGVSTQNLNLGLQRMTRRVAEAAQGSGEAQDALKELGLDASALADLSPDKQFAAIAERMNDVGSQSDRVRLAFKLFDSEGVALLNTLALGADEMERIQRESLALGSALDRIDSAQIEAANDALSNVREVAAGIGNRLAVAVSPVLTAIAQQFRAAAIESDGFRDAVDRGIKIAVNVVAALANGLRGLQVVFVALQAGGQTLSAMLIRGFELVAASIAKFVDGAIDDINSITRGISNIPGINIPEIPRLQDSAFISGLKFLADSVEQTAADSRARLNAMALEPLPGDAIKQFVADAQEAGRAAAEAAAVSAGGGGAGADAGVAGGGGDDAAARAAEDERKKTEARREGLAKRLEMLRNSLATEEELEAKRQAERLELLTAAQQEELAKLSEQTTAKLEAMRARLEEELITEEEFRALREEAEIAAREREAEIDAEFNGLREDVMQQHMDRLAQIKKRGLTEQEKLQKASGRDQLNAVISQGNAMLSAFGQSNDAFLAVAKISGAAQAFIATLTGQAEALKLGWPAGPIAAAQIGAQGFALVAAIKSATKGSSSGGGGAAAAAAGGAGGGAGGGQQAPQQASSLVLNLRGGDLISIEDIARGLGDYLNDGGRIGSLQVNRI